MKPEAAVEENTNILIADSAPIVEAVVVKRVLSDAGSSEIIFSTDETLAYEPDSAENTESFDTVVADNPLPVSE